ncbi:UNVERIFIED_CONTAM: hypothetical protein FKN15_062128 [Acipenser sinensis]
MKGIHSLAGLLLLIIVEGSWQIPLQETGDMLLKMTEAEPIDEPEELLNVKHHSQCTFTNEYNKYLEAKHAQEFVQWLIKSKRRGGLTRRHADGTYTSDISSFLQDQAAKEFVSWLKKGRGKREMTEEEPTDESRELINVKRHSQGMFTNDYSKYLEEKAAQDFVEWLKHSKSKRSGMTEELSDEPGELTNVKRHSQGMFTNDYSKYLEEKRAKEFVEWLKNGESKRSGIAAHVPDLVVYADLSREIPYVENFHGVLLFVDISGDAILALWRVERIQLSNMISLAVKCSLNIQNNCDNRETEVGVKLRVKIGDAILALWRVERIQLSNMISLAVKCSLNIQNNCDNRETEVGVKLRVKIGISAGKISKVVMGGKDSKYFVVIGRAVDEVRLAEGLAVAHSIILSPNAWEMCDRDTIATNPIENERAVKIDDDQPLEYLSEMRPVTIVFVNLQFKMGTTETELCLIMQNAALGIGQLIRKHQGRINKVFMFDKGCTFLCVFGLPGDKREDECAHALLCAYTIHEYCSKELKVSTASVGVTSGPVFCGVVGHPMRHEYTVIGRKVNMAARLMMYYPGVVSCDKETCVHSKLPSFYFNELPKRPMKGVQNPGTIYQYLARKHQKTVGKAQMSMERVEGYHLLGRDKEIDVFNSALKQFLECRSSGSRNYKNVIMYEGDVGFGKSSVLAEIVYRAAKEGVRVIAFEIAKSDIKQQFYTVQTLLAIVLSVQNCKSYAERERLLLSKIKDQKQQEKLCLLNDLLLVKALEVEACLFVFDQAHYIDFSSWELIIELCEKTSAFMIMALRPFNLQNPPFPPAAKVMRNPNTLYVKLSVLEPSVIAQLACQILGVIRIPREMELLLVERSHGVPYYCEELLRSLYLSKMIVLEQLDEEDEEDVDILFSEPKIVIENPKASMALAQLDHMQPAEQMIVKFASIIGYTFTTQMLQYILIEGADQKLNQSLDSLFESHTFECASRRKETWHPFIMEKKHENTLQCFCTTTEQESIKLDDTGSSSSSYGKFRTRINKVAPIDNSRFEGSFLGKLDDFEGSFLGKLDDILAGSEQVAQTCRKCKCADIVECVLCPMVRHCMGVGDVPKTFYFLLETAAAATILSNNLKALSYLNEATIILDLLRAGKPPFETAETKGKVKIRSFEKACAFRLKGEIISAHIDSFHYCQIVGYADCVELLCILEYLVNTLQNSIGKGWFYAACFDILLQGGKKDECGRIIVPLFGGRRLCFTSLSLMNNGLKHFGSSELRLTNWWNLYGWSRHQYMSVHLCAAEARFSLKQFDECLSFVEEAQSDPIIMAEKSLMLNLYASLALWFARLNEWDQSRYFFVKALRIVDQAPSSVYSINGHVKFLECYVLVFRKALVDKNNHTVEIYNRTQKHFSDFKSRYATFVQYDPRFLHLKAYMYLISGQQKLVKSFLQKALKISQNHSNKLEECWIRLSEVSNCIFLKKKKCPCSKWACNMHAGSFHTVAFTFQGTLCAKDRFCSINVEQKIENK